MNWSDLGEWWLSESGDDPAYEEEVTPLLMEVFDPVSGERYLDLGCGNGRVMRTVEAETALVHGIDINFDLVSSAGLAVVASLPSIPMRAGSYDGVYSVLTLEHVDDVSAFFFEASRVTKAGGVLCIVLNHPVWTAPDSTPISDSDGEVLWRPGAYFSSGSSELRAGSGSVTFRHRSMASLLNAAASAGWALEKMVERPHHELEDQAGIPRLLACRWRRSDS
jgi:ubiquinone/menaquinone biosynthesis C-methylase UbiE